MIESKQKSFWLLYLVMGLVFILSVIFNEYIDIAGVRPDILLIILIFLATREKKLIALCAAFFFGLIQDVVLPGDAEYWGLAPLLKTLLIFSFLKIIPLIGKFRGFILHLTVFSGFLVYFVFYNLFYYSGFMDPFVIFYRYALTETIYTFLIYLLLNMIFPSADQKR
ncbi:MAG: hypothetical protein WCT23_07550 [Candidatus Neomarinimicrobiota bacterium]